MPNNYLLFTFSKLNFIGFQTIFIRCRFFAQLYPWVPIVHGVVTFFVIANFTLATFMDPGVIPKGKLNFSLLKFLVHDL